MPGFYVEYCVWMEAESQEEAQKEAERIAAKISENAEVSSASVNSVEECDPDQ